MGASTMAEAGMSVASATPLLLRACVRDDAARAACSAATHALARNVEERLRQRAISPREARCATSSNRMTCAVWTTSASCRSPSRPNCATTIRSGCSRGRAAARATARVVGNDRQADRRRVHGERSTRLGRSDGALVRLRRRTARRSSSTTRTATGCSPAAWARTTVRSDSARPSCRCRAASTERQIALITDFGARVLCSTPSYALAIAEVAEQQGVDLRQIASSRSVCSGPNRGARRCASEIEARLGLKAVDIYGLSEIMGPGSRANAKRRRPACTAGRTISCSRSSIRTPTRRCRRACGRARDHHAHQRGAADAPLPHARHHAAVARAPAFAGARICASCASRAATTTC